MPVCCQHILRQAMIRHGYAVWQGTICSPGCVRCHGTFIAAPQSQWEPVGPLLWLTQPKWTTSLLGHQGSVSSQCLPGQPMQRPLEIQQPLQTTKVSGFRQVDPAMSGSPRLGTVRQGIIVAGGCDLCPHPEPPGRSQESEAPKQSTSPRPALATFGCGSRLLHQARGDLRLGAPAGKAAGV